MAFAFKYYSVDDNNNTIFSALSCSTSPPKRHMYPARLSIKPLLYIEPEVPCGKSKLLSKLITCDKCCSVRPVSSLSDFSPLENCMFVYLFHCSKKPTGPKLHGLYGNSPLWTWPGSVATVSSPECAGCYS